jgi:hypothetical protein
MSLLPFALAAALVVQAEPPPEGGPLAAREARRAARAALVLGPLALRSPRGATAGLALPGTF